MKRLFAAVGLLLLLWNAGDARPIPAKPSSGFPQTVRVRLWYLHPPGELRLRAEAGQAQLRKCAACKPVAVATLTLHATQSSIQMDGDKSPTAELRISGAYQISADGEKPLHADFPIEVHANNGHLLITALMPMEEYVAGVLAGETGNFKSDEALKAMAVAARTFAMHFGSRHALDGFEFCDTTHCQDLRVAGIDAHLRSIALATAGEILWLTASPRPLTMPRTARAPAKTDASFWATTKPARPISTNTPTSTACATAAHNGAARCRSASCNAR
jgi:stage II sporulation SpoD-like protein